MKKFVAQILCTLGYTHTHTHTHTKPRFFPTWPISVGIWGWQFLPNWL